MTSPRSRLPRRRFLQAAGLGALSLPMLPSLVSAQSGGGKPPKRLIFFYSANGTVVNKWNPGGDGGADFTLSEILSPLEGMRDKITLVEGLDMSAVREGPGSAHQRGMGGLLTGMPMLSGNFTGGGNASCGWASGPSVDQHIVSVIKPPTKFPSLQLGVRATGGENRVTMVYEGSDKPILMDNDPYNVFRRVFSDFDKDAVALERLRLQRRSVLDAVSGDFTSLTQRAPAEDRARLQAHAESIRSIEERLAAPIDGAQCDPPTIEGDRISVDNDKNVPQILKLQMDMLVHALKCDLTRVASVQLGRATSGIKYSWLGVNDGHHSISHEGDGNQAAQDRLTKINRWTTEQFAYLIESLEAIKEADGSSLLDNTIVIWGNSLGKGNNHTFKDIPFVMAGSCQGFFKTGWHQKYGSRPHNDLLVSVCQAMGMEENTFGHANHCTGAATELHK